MSFNIIIDSEKSYGFIGNKLSAVLPKTLFFSAGKPWEMALVSVWYNTIIHSPIYINCSIIETQIVGDKWEKTLFVLMPPLEKDGTIIFGNVAGSYHQFKKIFDPHVSKIDLSFNDSKGAVVIFPKDAHMIFNLEIRRC